MKFADNKNHEMHGSDNDQAYIPDEDTHTTRQMNNIKTSVKTSLTTSNLPYVTRSYLTANMIDMNQMSSDP